MCMYVCIYVYVCILVINKNMHSISPHRNSPHGMLLQ